MTTIFIAGDTHGNLTRLYDNVLALEQKEGLTADWVLQTGNLGVWPDPNRITRSNRKHGDVDFFKYYLEGKSVPRPTVFVAGKHEDHRWLNFMLSRGQLEILPNLTWLLNGYQTHIGNGEEMSLVGLGKAYSPKSYEGPNKDLSHYTRAEITKACAHGPTDILLCHEAGKGARLGTHTSEAEGINNLCFALRPRVMIHGHFNVSQVYKNPVTETTTISLAFNEVRALCMEENKITLFP
jgi:hypothetical protein